MNSNSNFGQEGVDIVSRYMQMRGHTVLRVQDIGNAKSKEGAHLHLSDEASKLILPDLLTIRGDKIQWVEVKRKSDFSWGIRSQCWQEGIDVQLYTSYMQVRQVTGWPVILVFYHDNSISRPADIANGAPKEQPAGIFAQWLTHLSTRVDHRDISSRVSAPCPMVYWNIIDLEQRASLEELRQMGIID